MKDPILAKIEEVLHELFVQRKQIAEEINRIDKRINEIDNLRFNHNQGIATQVEARLMASLAEAKK